MMVRSSRQAVLAALCVSSALLLSGCGVVVFTAAAGGGGWETYQHNQMESLEEQYAAGKITRQEYEAQRSQIQQASLLQR